MMLRPFTCHGCRGPCPDSAPEHHRRTGLSITRVLLQLLLSFLIGFCYVCWLLMLLLLLLLLWAAAGDGTPTTGPVM